MTDQPKFCSVCGMPLQSVEDYPEGADINSVDWCRYCGTKDALDSFENRLKGMTKFVMKMQNIPEEEAKTVAEQALKSSVAYKSGRLK